MKYKIIIDDKTTIQGELDGDLSKLIIESDEGDVFEHKNIKKKVDIDDSSKGEGKVIFLKDEIERD